MSFTATPSIVRLQERVGFDHPDRVDANEYIATTLRITRERRKVEYIEAEADVHDTYDKYQSAVRKFEDVQESVNLAELLSDVSSERSSRSSLSGDESSISASTRVEAPFTQAQKDYMSRKQADLIRASWNNFVNIDANTVVEQE